MARKQRRYPPEFLREIVGLVRSGRSPESLAEEFDPSMSAIRKWVKQADLDEGHRNDGLTTSEGDAALYEEPFRRVQERVYPMRQRNRRKA